MITLKATRSSWRDKVAGVAVVVVGLAAFVGTRVAGGSGQGEAPGDGAARISERRAESDAKVVEDEVEAEAEAEAESASEEEAIPNVEVASAEVDATAQVAMETPVEQEGRPDAPWSPVESVESRPDSNPSARSESTPLEKEPEPIALLDPVEVVDRVQRYQSHFREGKVEFRLDFNHASPREIESLADQFVLTKNKTSYLVDLGGGRTRLQPGGGQSALWAALPDQLWPAGLEQEAERAFGPGARAEAYLVLSPSRMLVLLRNVSTRLSHMTPEGGGRVLLRVSRSAAGAPEIRIAQVEGPKGVNP